MNIRIKPWESVELQGGKIIVDQGCAVVTLPHSTQDIFMNRESLELQIPQESMFTIITATSHHVYVRISP